MLGLGLGLGLGLHLDLTETIKNSGFGRTARILSKSPTRKKLEYVRSVMAAI